MNALPQKPRVVTLGCRLNAFESEAMRGLAEGAGLSATVFVNTCAVTKEAERQARQTIRRLRRENPEARIVVTGCAAQINPDAFAAMPEVDTVLGNAEKLDPATFANLEDDAEVRVSDIMSPGPARPEAPLIGGLEGRTRAFVQVQQGCDHRCAFCIVPFARGPNRSLDMGRIVAQVHEVVDEGHGEVVLTGVDISSYGCDRTGHSGLGVLAGRILKEVPALKRLRLSSLDPAGVDPALFDLLGREDRLMAHLHLSLQAGDDMILKRMKRRHSRGQAKNLIRKILDVRPETVFGADLIAGFPTESHAMFENTLNAIDDLGLTFLHVFPYSPRPGTPAARMPQVAAALRKERAALLRQKGEEARDRFFQSLIGSTARVLVEKPGFGHSRRFAPVTFEGEVPSGEIADIPIASFSEGRLIGRRPGEKAA